MNEQSNKIHDMIETFPLDETTEMVASKMLDILQAMNERMDSIEVAARQAANTASCLANGIQPD